MYGYLDRLTRQVTLYRGFKIDCRKKTPILSIGGGGLILFNATGEYLLERESPDDFNFGLDSDFIFNTKQLSNPEEIFDEENEVQVVRIDRYNSYLYQNFEGVQLGLRPS